MKGNRVRFNVGGKKFETTATTLATAGTDSFFAPLLSDNWNTIATSNEEDEVVFIDRDPECFAVILNLLRTGELSIPPHVGKDSLIREAQFYGVLELVRVASWGSPLNIDLALPSSLITYPTPPSPFKMISGSPNGGFCVANDTSVHVYDWMLYQHSAIHLDNNKHGKLNEVLWVGTNNIAIATEETVRMFDAATGKLRHNFVDEKGNQVNGATSICLGDSNIFYKSRNDNRSIGMLDIESGKSIGSVYLQLPSTLMGIHYIPKNVWRHINLQTLDDSLLLGTYGICPPGFTGEHFEAQIFDTRNNKVVHSRSWTSWWYWYSRTSFKSNNQNRRIQSVTVMEDRNSICLIGRDGEIGFLDLRFAGDVEWGSKKVEECLASDRVVYQSDRIFMLSGGSLMVYSVPDFVVTAQISTKSDSGFDDFSISGDRLFMLHAGNNLVDVWETPRPCLSFL